MITQRDPVEPDWTLMSETSTQVNQINQLDHTLSVLELSVSRGDKAILTGVNFTLSPGKVLAVMGDSGAGKSSLIRALLGLEPHAQMTLEWAGSTPLHARRFGWVPQDSDLFPHLSVQDNIGFSAPYLGLSEEELQARLTALSERLSLSELLSRSAAQLSGGQRQRVALARALFAKAPVLLLDEPLAHLDQGARGELRSLISQVVHEEQVACLWVSHDPEEALEVATQIGLLHQGSLEGPVSPEVALEAPPTKVFAERFGRVDWFPIVQSEGEWRWGVAGAEVTWPLPTPLTHRAHSGALVGVRESGWEVSVERGQERGEALKERDCLEMWVERSWPQPWGRTLALRGSEGVPLLSVQALIREPIATKERVWLYPREVFLVE